MYTCSLCHTIATLLHHIDFVIVYILTLGYRKGRGPRIRENYTPYEARSINYDAYWGLWIVDWTVFEYRPHSLYIMTPMTSSHISLLSFDFILAFFSSKGSMSPPTATNIKYIACIFKHRSLPTCACKHECRCTVVINWGEYTHLRHSQEKLPLYSTPFRPHWLQVVISCSSSAVFRRTLELEDFLLGFHINIKLILLRRDRVDTRVFPVAQGKHSHKFNLYACYRTEYHSVHTDCRS